jgi:type I restriction enzyme R subunit
LSLSESSASALQEALNRYRSRAIESAQVIEELIQWPRNSAKRQNAESSLVLNDSELAFYDALADNESAMRELGDITLKKIALELTEKLRTNTTVDWQKARECPRPLT